MRLHMPYRFCSSEAGIFNEIYLPKKVEYQGTLYKTLRDGLDIQLVRRHLGSKTKKRKIRQLIRGLRIGRDFTDVEMKNVEPVFFGYSMYEVDGVFSRTNHVIDPIECVSIDERTDIIEERTQVIRLMWVFDFTELERKYARHKVDVIDVVRRYLRHTGRRRRFLATLMEKKDKSETDRREIEIATRVKKLVEDSALLLFGYIVYEICENVLKLVKADGAIDLDRAEDEIWVTSFWTLAVNRVKYQSLTVKQIKSRYRSKWILIGDPEVDAVSRRITKAKVLYTASKKADADKAKLKLHPRRVTVIQASKLR